MKKYQTEFKLKVVSSFLAGDGGAKLLARQWSVPEEKIRTWVRKKLTGFYITALVGLEE
jgi:transposase